jgi:hypothetical protein
MRNGVMPSSDYSIPNIAVGNGGNLTVTGGTILALESAGDHNENAIWITQGGSASISGGYITRIWARTLTKYVSGGFFYARPGATYLADGLSAIPGTYANTAYPEDTRTYNYEIAEGVVIEATSGVKLGELGAVASISGGGLKKKNASFTLTAPEMSGFEFLGWFLGTTSLGTGYTYTATADASKTIEAVYDYGPATGFAVTVGGTADYTITGTTVGDKYVSGTEVTVAYTGTDAFEGWINDSGKIVSRDAEYVFTVISDVSLTANTGSAATPIVVFYNASNQVMFTKTVGGANPVADSDFASVPAVVGKKNGRWTVKGTAVTSVDTLLAAAGDSTAIDVIATYDPDDAAVYDLTVVGVELGESGLLSTWTAYAAGDQSFTGINKTATVLLSAPAGAKTFLYYAAEDGTILSMSAETYIRYQESTTIYAVYGDASVQAGPAVTMISAFRDGTTIYFEALRDIPEGYTVKEQGILFGLTEDLTYGASGTYKYVSSGKNAHDVTALTLKNIAAGTTVYGRGYVIFTDGTDEGIIYTVKTPVQ